MKYLSLFLCLLLCSCRQKVVNENYSVEYKGNYSEYKGIDTLSTYHVDRYIIDLDYDNKTDTIILENLKDLKGDPQTFTILKVKLGTKREFVFKNVQGGLLDKSAKFGLPNRLNSDKLYIPDTKGKESLIFVWDYQYPDCSAEFAAYQINSNGIIEKLNQNFYVSKIADFDGKGRLAVIGKSDCGEETASDTIFVSL